MFELARCFGEAPVVMSTIAQRQRLSRKHVHALLTSLKSAGLVRSVRGRQGGFFLTRPPKEIRLSEVLRALEGPLSLVDCVADRRACDRADRCVARRVWQHLSRAVENMLGNVTLEDMTALDREEGSGRRSRSKSTGVRRK
jgi:Rrf2 family protein